ncbi:hypothetical protein Tco_1569494 [Tanacetum coccineum]
MSENIEALENVVEDKPYFLTEGLLGPNGGRCGGIGRRGGSMAGRGGGWLAKRSIILNEGCSGGGLVVRGGRSYRESKNGRGDVGGVEKISSTGSKLIANGEDRLDGCDGVGGDIMRLDG